MRNAMRKALADNAKSTEDMAKTFRKFKLGGGSNVFSSMARMAEP